MREKGKGRYILGLRKKVTYTHYPDSLKIKLLRPESTTQDTKPTDSDTMANKGL